MTTVLIVIVPLVVRIEGAAMNDRAHIVTVREFMDKNHKWHWQVRSQSGKVIGQSISGFTRKVDCSTNMHRVSSALMPPIKWES